MPAAAKAPPKPTEKEIKDFLALKAEQREYEQKARAIARRTKAFEDQATTHLEAKKKSTLKIGSYRLSLVDGRPSVRWKDQFIEIAGHLKAQELLDQAPKPKKLDVQPA